MIIDQAKANDTTEAGAIPDELAHPQLGMPGRLRVLRQPCAVDKRSPNDHQANHGAEHHPVEAGLIWFDGGVEHQLLTASFRLVDGLVSSRRLMAS